MSVMADAGLRLRQILVNLLGSNAVKFTEQAGEVIPLSLSARRRRQTA